MNPSAAPAIPPAHATLTLQGERLELRCSAANLREDRTLGAADVQRFQDWSARHLALAKERGHGTSAAAFSLGTGGAASVAGGLLALGQEMGAWLEGATADLTRILDAGSLPVVLECGIKKQDKSALARAFLDAPWELLALESADQHLALAEDTALTVIRRIGPAQPPPPPSVHRLGVVFMAAAPRGGDNLNWEAEETAILTRTQSMGLDLVVEESGTLELLGACVAREKPDVVQISCHGTLRPEPGLVLEDAVGDADVVPAPGLISGLSAHQPRLLFLSACHTAESHAVLDSLAQSLVRAGAPAVLGWAAPVSDTEAALFAALLLENLAKGMALPQALAHARLALARHKDLKEREDGSPRARDWHLARLYFSAPGGGSLATAGGPQRLSGHGQAAKTFLDVRNSKVPVAGDLEFVGRRREVQTIMREFRAPPSQRRAGVLIHGMGRQGKSSLVARVARRLENTHEVLVIFDRYDAPAILSTFRDRLGTPEVNAVVAQHLPLVEQNPALLQQALSTLLQGPCQQFIQGQSNRPVLLIVDDFEQVLVAHASGRHTLKPEVMAGIRALITAFQNAKTESRLLFTSRFEFTLPDSQDRELAARLLPLPLRGMSDRESHKQATAKLRQQTQHSRQHQGNLPALEQRLPRIQTAAQGNAGLQDLLFSLCLENPAACDQCLEQMEAYRATGQAPDAEGLRQFLEELAIARLLDLLAPPARALLRASTLFQVPVPVTVMQALAHSLAADDHAIARLLELGLWEAYEDLHNPHQRALAINALVHPLVNDLSETEQRQHAATVTLPLFEAWGAEEEAEERNMLQDYELTRLALMAPQPRVLTSAAARALRALNAKFDYKTAAAWAQAVMGILDAAGVPASVSLLRAAAERCQKVGLVQEAAQWRSRALAWLEQVEDADNQSLAQTLVEHSRALVQQGQPNEALRLLERAQTLLPPGRERAIALGDIAHIRASKGEVDAALALHHEEMVIYESLGDKHSRAVTLGDIARIRADKGEVDAALALHQEKLQIIEALGDKGERAVTLGDIARIRANKGEVDAALGLYQEALTIHEALGDKRSRAVTLGDIARIRASKGEVDTALALHYEKLEIVQALGDTRERAVTLGGIARIRASKGEVDAALALHQERLSVYEALGEKRSWAVTLGDIARIQASKGDVDAALALHQEELVIYEALGDKRERALTLGDIARIRADRGELDAALEMQQQRLQVNHEISDKDGIAAASFDLARVEMQQKQWQASFQHLAESYAIFLQLGRLDAICGVGMLFGRLLCAAGQRDKGREILERSLAGFQKLGWQREIQQTQAILAELFGEGGGEAA